MSTILQPLTFEWNSSINSNTYEFMISKDSLFSESIVQNINTTNPFVNDIFLSHGKWYWKIISDLNDSSTISSLRIIDPDSLTNLRIWLKSDTGVSESNGKVVEWQDISINQNHVLQNNLNNAPQLESINPEINNINSIRFDGNDFLNTNDLNTQEIEVFVVFKGENILNKLFQIGNGYWSNFNTNNPRPLIYLSGTNLTYFEPEQETNVFQYHNFGFKDGWVNNNNTFINVNGIPLTKSNGAGNGSSTYTVNNMRIGYQMEGLISEVIVMDSLISPGNRDDLNDYLNDKYAPPVNLGPDISVDYGFCNIELETNGFFQNLIWSTGDTSSSISVNEPGIYWVQAQNIFGRFSTDTILISRPIYDQIQLQNQLVCFNEPDTITANLPQGDYTFVQWSDGNTNPTRILNQNESITYSVLDSSGCIRTSNTATITIDNSLEHISLGIDTNICSGNSIELIQTSNNIINWLWNNQDTTTSIEINSSGIYDLQVTNSNGCQNSDTIEVTIIGVAPDLSYSIPLEICQGSELNFTENSTVPPGNTISQVVWDFGDLDSSFNSNGSHIYVDSGDFNASLQVSTLEGCSSQDQFVITVHPKPIISFTTEKYCPYEEIEFSASNEYDIPLFFYNWEFGQNASSSTDIFPSYTYGISGNYDVQLTAVDTNNCTDTVIQNVFIQPGPVAEISIINPCEYTPLEITDNSSIADTFSIVTYSWNYGDNTGAINPSEDKIYESYGEYNVQLVLEANNGCVDTLEQLITVHPKPVLVYDVGPACKNTWTSLENISTIPEGTITETNWLINLQYDFNQQNTAFNFPTLGIQLVNLESISDQGCISDTTFEIDVQNEISADYTVNPMNLTSGTPIQFINESFGADSSFWDFGGGNGLQFNQNQVNEITYDQSLNGSSIDVALVITNDIGCRDTSSYTYEIKEAFLDLALQTLFVQDINGYLTVGIELSNLGSVMIENADLYLKSAENGSILENWTGQLAQNESEIYIFNAHPPSYSSTQDDTERFICVEGNVRNSGYFDVDVSNNIICKNIEGSGLVVLPIYPNPTDDDITVSILLTESSPLRVELVDQSGRLILNQDYTENLDSGIHKIVLPFSSLQKGIYHLRVSDSSTTLLEKIVRN